MERETGIEPATLSLGSCATTFAYVRGCIEISYLRPQASGDIHPCCGQNCGQTGRADAAKIGCRGYDIPAVSRHNVRVWALR